MTNKKFDVAVLGSGPGGYVAAARAAQLGAAVAIIEARELGGVCLNRGCIPTKALIESARALTAARNAGALGVKVDNAAPDFAAMCARRDKVVAMMRNGVGAIMKRNKVEVIAGRGRLAARDRIVVTGDDGEQTIAAAKIIIATGSEPARPKMFPFDGTVVLTSDDLLKLEAPPASLLVIGGGYIGCEWAGFFRALGVEVTIVEMMDQLLPKSDPDIAKELFKAFKKSKVDIHLKTKVESLKVAKGEARAKLDSGKDVAVAKVLVAVGRSFNSADIGLEEVGVKTDNGAIVIDDHCQTNVPGIYAIGDVTGKLMLAHMAAKQGKVAAEHARGREARVDYLSCPMVVFTSPEIGAVGLTEAQAREQGMTVKSVKFPFQVLGKAHAMGETAGFFKIIAGEKYGEVVGVHIIGAHATDLVAEAALAMHLECTVEEIADTIHAHPTLAEGMMEAAEQWLGNAIHG